MIVAWLLLKMHLSLLRGEGWGPPCPLLIFLPLGQPHYVRFRAFLRLSSPPHSLPPAGVAYLSDNLRVRYSKLSFSVFLVESQVTSESSPESSCRSGPHNVGSCWPGWGRLCDSAHASSSGVSFPGMKVTSLLLYSFVPFLSWYRTEQGEGLLLSGPLRPQPSWWW